MSLDEAVLNPTASRARMRARGSVMNIDELVEVDPEKMGGVPVFTGTRVPINHLFEYLEGGDSLEEFLDQFPTVEREQAQGVLELSRKKLLADYEAAA